MVAPQVVKRVQPDFSGIPGHMIRGVGIFEATITSAGDVVSIRTMRSLGPRFDPPVITALKQWKYRPATMNGKPVAVYFTLTVNIHFR